MLVNKKSKPIIAVDIDEVLAEHAPSFIDWSNQTLGTELTIDDYHEDWVAMWNVDTIEFEKRRAMYFQSDIFKTMKHHEVSIDVLKKLQQKYQLLIVTARSSFLQQITLDWIEKKYPDVFHGVHFANIWDMPAEDRHLLTKTKVLKNLGADYLIDDQLKHCIGAADVGIAAVLFGDYAWNRSDTLPEKVTRCHDWLAVEEYFNERN